MFPDASPDPPWCYPASYFQNSAFLCFSSANSLLTREIIMFSFFLNFPNNYAVSKFSRLKLLLCGTKQVAMNCVPWGRRCKSQRWSTSRVTYFIKLSICWFLNRSVASWFPWWFKNFFTQTVISRWNWTWIQHTRALWWPEQYLAMDPASARYSPALSTAGGRGWWWNWIIDFMAMDFFYLLIFF